MSDSEHMNPSDDLRRVSKLILELLSFLLLLFNLVYPYYVPVIYEFGF